MTDPIRIGTRRSPLARAQTEAVVRRLRRASPSSTFEVVPVQSAGDLTTASAPDFTGVFEEMLESHRIDLAVHSAKDLPARTPPAFAILAYPPRADPRDCLIVRGGLRSGPLPARARVGSSSLRRRAQLLRWRPDLQVREIRGNVGTRMGLVRARAVDAVVIAVAGVVRLGRRDEIAQILPIDRFLPAPGQGALALEGRRGDRHLGRVAGPIDLPTVRAAVTAERELAAAVGGDCNLPLGALGRVRSGRLTLRAEALSLDGSITITAGGSDSVGQAARLGRRIGMALNHAGARELLTQAVR